MDIRTYYNRIAQTCFYAAWTCLGLALLFFIMQLTGVMNTNVFVTTVPFILFSIVQFIGHRIYENRIVSLPELTIQKNSNLFEVENLLITFLPAPTLRMLLFAPDGKLLGEIRDQNMRWFLWLIPGSLSLVLPKKYGLYGADGDMIAEYRIRGGISNYVNMVVNGELIGTFQQKFKESLFSIKGTIRRPNGQDWMSVSAGSFLTNFEIKNSKGEKMVSFQKGWMPREWSLLFKELNTPILTFYSSADEYDKMAVLGFMASAMNHHSN